MKPKKPADVHASTKVVSVVLTLEEIAAVDSQAAAIGISRSQYIGQLIREKIPGRERFGMKQRRPAHRPANP